MTHTWLWTFCYSADFSSTISEGASMLASYEGGCQCGFIRYRITSEASVVYACHCTICQTQSGSAFAMAMRVPAEHFHLLTGQLKIFERPGKNQILICSFCPECGTRIHHVPERTPGQVSLKPGTLDDTSWLRPSVHFFSRSAQPWVKIPDDAQIFETMPENRSWLSETKA